MEENDDETKTFEINVIGCKNLMERKNNQPPNPFVVLKLMNKEKQTFQSDIINKTCNPSFNMKLKLTMKMSDNLKILCYDKDVLRKSLIGELNIDFNQIKDGKKKYTLLGENARGEIEIIFFLSQNSSVDMLSLNREINPNQRRRELNERLQKSLESNLKNSST